MISAIAILDLFESVVTFLFALVIVQHLYIFTSNLAQIRVNVEFNYFLLKTPISFFYICVGVALVEISRLISVIS
jgi:hypothetical protein